MRYLLALEISVMVTNFNKALREHEECFRCAVKATARRYICRVSRRRGVTSCSTGSYGTHTHTPNAEPARKSCENLRRKMNKTTAALLVIVVLAVIGMAAAGYRSGYGGGYRGGYDGGYGLGYGRGYGLRDGAEHGR
ncbi:PREDICTED: uncharacterized protein LOC106818232 [Priapulus caudatus]|uniref:Uncharacterized protein LOC106818232 n=1 Tax=Priapulus caudatus TaxID=37621 RepID=A0ABM1F1X2_PRICU|nr:PREDICTED: uncharacterized protein LOC106818232 [Priapulus caudatus]